MEKLHRLLAPLTSSTVAAAVGFTEHADDRPAVQLRSMICNDLWYVEQARILASKGAAVILVPTNSGHLRNTRWDNRLRIRSQTLPVARAVDNTVSVVIADIASEQQGRAALGSSRILDPDGAPLCAADPMRWGSLSASSTATHARSIHVAGMVTRTRP